MYDKVWEYDFILSMQISLSLRRNNSLIWLIIQSILKSPRIIHGVFSYMSISLSISQSFYSSIQPSIHLIDVIH